MTVTALLHDERYNQYCIQNKLAILKTLKTLLSNNTLINGYIEDISLVTAILHLDNNFLYLDISRDEKVNKSILKSGRLLCFCYESKINIQFELYTILPATYLNKPSFRCSIPDMLLRLQRREYYRVDVPFNTSHGCLVRSSENTEYTPVKVCDLSSGGLSISSDQIILEPGLLLKDSKLTLPEVGTLIVDLEVCYIRQLDKVGISDTKAGVRFINLKSRDLIHIQKYIMSIERSRIVNEF